MAKSAEEEKIAKIIQNQNKLLDDQLAKEKQLAVLQKERTGYMEREADAARTRAEEAKARLDMASEAMQISEEERKVRLAIIKEKLAQAKIDADEEKISKEKLSDIQKYHDQLAPILKASEDQLKILHEQAKVEEEKAKLLKEQKEAVEGLANAMRKATGSATGIGDAWKEGDGVGSQIAKAAVSGANFGEVLGSITSGMGQSLTAANLLGSVITNMVSSTADLFTEMDKSLADFRVQTGLPPEFESSITRTRQEMVHLGVITRDITQAFGELSKANTAYVFQSAATRDSLLRTATAMKVAYGASQEFSEAIAFSMTAMAESPKQAEKTALGLAKFAKDIKASPKEMMEDYASLGPRLAAWGKNATKVFKETAAAAKALNIESAALLDIAGQFDTFDEAAGHVGQLNAMLGGDYFDTVEMVNASESERIEMLMEGVRATGKSWDSLGRFERKAIATAAGISDMAEANKMFGQGLDVYKELQEQVNNTAMSYNDLSDAARENMSIQEKQAAIQKSLAVSLEPFMDIANSVLGVIQSLASATGALFPWLVLGTAWVLKWAVAQGAWVAVMNSSLVVSAWMYTTIIAETIATKALALAKGTLALVQKGVNAVMKSGLVTKTLSLAATLAETIATKAAAIAKGGLSLAIGAYNVVAGIATAVTSALAAAVTFLLSPIGLTILAIGLLIGIVVGLIYYWDELTSYVTNLTGGFADMWDVLMLLMGPIGWLAIIPKKIYENWEPIKQLFLDIVDAISAAASAVADFASWAWDSATGQTNTFGGSIASNADGSTNFSGTSLVGERGPEIITTQGANIITNENITRLIETNERVTQSVAGARRAERATAADPLESVFEMIGRNLGIGGGNQQAAPAMAAAGPGVQTQVIMEIDGEKFGKVVLEPYLEKILKPKVEA